MEAEVAAVPMVSEPVPSQESTQALSGLKEEIGESPLEEEMDTTEHKEAAASGEEKQASPAPSSPHSSLNSPLLPLPDFMTALNMMPSGKPPQGGVGRGEGAGQQPAPSSHDDLAQEGGLTLGPGPKEVLIEKFKQNPNGVLDLLQSALSIEKLSSLLQEEHRGDNDLLMQLQNRLEAAYHTLRECEETKGDLGKKITDSNQQITEKRKHLEDLRGELKILGDEELRLKRKRDISHNKYAEFRKKLTCSTEALEQISHITKLMDPTGSESDVPTPADTTVTSTPVSMATTTTAVSIAMPTTNGTTGISGISTTSTGAAASGIAVTIDTVASTSAAPVIATTAATSSDVTASMATNAALMATTAASADSMATDAASMATNAASMATNAASIATNADVTTATAAPETMETTTTTADAVASGAEVEATEEGSDTAPDSSHQVKEEDQEQQSIDADLSGL